VADPVIGQTTESDIIKALGPPSQVVRLRDQTVFYYLMEHREGKGAILLLCNWVLVMVYEYVDVTEQQIGINLNFIGLDWFKVAFGRGLAMREALVLAVDDDGSQRTKEFGSWTEDIGRASGFSSSSRPSRAIRLGTRSPGPAAGQAERGMRRSQGKIDGLPPGPLCPVAIPGFSLRDYHPLANVCSISLRKTTAGSAALYATSSQLSCTCAAISRLTLMPWERPSGSPPIRIDSPAGSSLP
jgi:hypothetical protein